MEAFQTLFVIAVEVVLIPLIIAAFSIGLSWFQNPVQARSIKHLIAFDIGLLLFLIAVYVLSTAPYFDFIDRCGPIGTGLCVDGRTPDMIRLELWRDLVLATLIYLVAPVCISILGYQFLKKLNLSKQPHTLLI